MSSIGDRFYTAPQLVDQRNNKAASPYSDDPFVEGFSAACFASQHDGALVLCKQYTRDERNANLAVDPLAFLMNTAFQEAAAGWWDDPGEFDCVVARLRFFAAHDSIVRLRVVLSASSGTFVDTGSTSVIYTGALDGEFTIKSEVTLVNTINRTPKDVSIQAYSIQEVTGAARAFRPRTVSAYAERRF